MKKKVKKLSLNKETVRSLTDDELRGVAGADPTQHGPNCATVPVTCAASCAPGCTDECTCRPNSSPCELSCPGTICP